MKSSVKQPHLKPVPNSDKYELTEDYNMEVGGLTIRIPKGFQYDGASIPRIFWRVIKSPFQPKFMAPALCHDWLYTENIPGVDKSLADDIFYHLLLLNGVKKTKAKLMHQAVKWFGGGHFKKT